MSMSVYWIRHPDHTDIMSQGYIGITTRFTRRMFEHKALSTNAYLNNAIKKYGWDNLIKEVVLIADKAYCMMIETQLRSEDHIGWNLVKGGGVPPVNKWNKGTKGLMTAWNKGLPWSKEARKQISNGVKKLWEDPSYKQHMSDAHKGQQSAMKGKKHTAEALKRMSEVKLGKTQSKETIEKRVAKIKGKVMKKLTCSHCNKIGGVSAMKRWHFDNCKLKGTKIC